MLRLCLFFAKTHLSVEPSWILDLELTTELLTQFSKTTIF